MIRKDGALNLAPGRKRHFKRIALDLARDRAGNRQPRLRVVGARRQDQGRTSASLLVPGLRIERQPDEIPSVGNVRTSYHVS